MTNRSARTNDAPEHFDNKHIFIRFVPANIEGHHRADAEKEVDKISQIIDGAIDDINQVYQNIIHEYPDPDTLIGMDIQTGEKHEQAIPRASRQGHRKTPDGAVL